MIEDKQFRHAKVRRTQAILLPAPESNHKQCYLRSGYTCWNSIAPFHRRVSRLRYKNIAQNVTEPRKPFPKETLQQIQIIRVDRFQQSQHREVY